MCGGETAAYRPEPWISVNTAPSIPPRSYGPYEVISTIGRGGNATVYKVRHRATRAIAALKVGPPMQHLEPNATERFQQEFNAIAPLRHPSVVRALALNEQDGVAYLVLEFVPGQSLDDWLKEKGTLPVAQAVQVFRQIADGLRYLHANHILHRDIKPSNVLLTPYDQAKLVDFGLLKNLKEDKHLTTSRRSMGTIDYGAPEQFEDAKRADHRCDIFSLAATFYTALTGKFPFGNGNHLQIMQRKLLHQYVPLRLAVPSIEPAIDKLVNWCLQPNPSERPNSCDAIMGVLRTCAGRPAPVAPSEEAPCVAQARPVCSVERRATVRFAVELTASFVPFHQNMRGSWSATILDVSPGGISLQTPRPVAVHSVLQVNLVKGAAPELVQVRWVKPGDDDTHVAGCSFVRPVPAHVLEAMCQAESQPEAEASEE
jgi:serine/threonine protein kinase